MALSCSAKIPSEPERKAVLAWVRGIANGGFSENGDTISLVYIPQAGDPESSSRWWAIIHYFKHYPEHTIDINGASMEEAGTTTGQVSA